MTPKRIQRKRVRGWRMPENTVYVGRPTVFGNPFLTAREFWEWWHGAKSVLNPYFGLYADQRDKLAANISRLKGKNLACWCSLGETCHADVLLELANADASRRS